MDLRRIAGNGLIVFGVLNILNFYAPRPLPTIGLSAFVFGGLLVVAGILLRRKRKESAADRRTSSKNLFGANGREAGSGMGDPLLPVRALRLASQKGGRLTIAQAAMELDVPLNAAEAALDECAAKGTATVEVDPANGIATYRFPEFLTDN